MHLPSTDFMIATIIVIINRIIVSCTHVFLKHEHNVVLDFVCVCVCVGLSERAGSKRLTELTPDWLSGPSHAVITAYC